MIDQNKKLEPALPFTAILYLSFASFASAISLRVTDALLPRLANDFDVSLGDASYVITTFSIAYGLSQLFFGPLGDRFGKYLVVAWACLACAVTATLCALAPNYPMLLLARLLAGGTAAAVIPLSMAWLGDVVPYNQRQPVLARFLMGQILGLSSGALVGGFAADHLNWRVPFFFIAFIFLAIGGTLIATNRSLPAYALATRKSEGAPIRRMVTEFGQVLVKPWARVVLITVFLEGVFLYGAFAFIASHLHRVHGVSLSTAGSLIMLFGFGGLLYASAAKILVNRLGEVGLARWGGVLLATALLTIGLAPAWWWAVPGCFVAGLGFYMLHNTLQINATQMATERRGAAVASFASCFYLGQSVGVAIAGVLIEKLGTSLVISVGAAGVLLIALNFSRLRGSAAMFPAA
ncbi:MAG: MFS transporter [Glaciimonas sp.]|nr:MFS transporter [Glaciimonas sp.]